MTDSSPIYIPRLCSRVHVIVFLAALQSICISAFAGEIAEWSELTALTQPCAIHCCVSVDHFIYVIGGETGPAVSFAHVKDDGTLQLWQSTTPLPDAMGYNYAAAIAVDRRIYVFGGFSKAEVVTGAVASAEVKTDGSLGAWQMTTPLPEPIHGGAVATYQGRYVYYVGGFYRRTVFYAKLEASGSIGEWKEATHLPSPRSALAVFVVGDWIYAIAGNSGHQPDTLQNTVSKAHIREDGSIEQWVRETPLPIANEAFGAALVGRDIVVVGGTSGGQRPKSQSFVTNIREGGSLAEWVELKPPPKGLWNCAAVNVGNRIYVTGGRSQREDGSIEISNAVYGSSIHVGK